LTRAANTLPETCDGFEVAILCALKLESDAVEALMTDFDDEQGKKYGQAVGDCNAYTIGTLGGVPVVLAYPQSIGSLSAAAVANDLRHSFKNIKLGLVVGVAGGAPQTHERDNIYLGDVIISTAVIQYDLGRQYADGFRRKNDVENTLGRNQPQLAHFLRKMSGLRSKTKLTDKTNEYLSVGVIAPDHDHLYVSDYRHKHHDPQRCKTCSKCVAPDDPVCSAAERSSCQELGCDTERLMRNDDSAQTRYTRSGALSVNVHFGIVASANTVLKCGLHRDRLIEDEKVIGFEMEGAGTWDQFPTVVLKGVCDYADSHKHKGWQKYAAATAASCAKALLEVWQGSQHVG
jgi:nucleoside phosphorylase